ncbi:hypothetical protein DSO57_1014123 [Entomophthora muscae]|uniref:Uncharacterized protein n=1 Tax=Entomophthora muscae TaxID=34485 RepID=A0ACC2RK72_9FUNG|nr:hypothetical protein DSO57_1014123 [Entomophthora muscae]
MQTLEEKLRLREEEIEALKLQLDKAAKSRTIEDEVFKDLERNQSEINRSLQDQLKKTLETKAGLQGDEHEYHNGAHSDSSRPQNESDKAMALIKKLRFELEMERGQVNILRHDNKLLKELAVKLHASAEQEEEFMLNKLLKRISGLKKEKGDLMVQVEQEEEFLTNSLQKKLFQLQKEKIDLENALEQEQEFVVNKLQKQIDLLRLQYPSHTPSPTINPVQRDPLLISPPLLPSVMVSSSPPSGTWRPGHSPSASEYGGASPGIVEMLKAEVNSLRLKLADLEREVISANNQTRRYRNELRELRKTYNISDPDDSEPRSVSSTLNPSFSLLRDPNDPLQTPVPPLLAPLPLPLPPTIGDTLEDPCLFLEIAHLPPMAANSSQLSLYSTPCLSSQLFSFHMLFVIFIKSLITQISVPKLSLKAH